MEQQRAQEMMKYKPKLAWKGCTEWTKQKEMMKYKPKLGAELALLMRTRFAQKQKPELKYSRKRKHKEKEE